MSKDLWQSWEQRKEDILFDLIARPRITAVDIDAAVDNAKEKFNGEKGSKAEDMVVDALRGVRIVASVEKEGDHEDKRGNDIFVRFYTETKHQPVTIQVKSSFERIKRFEQTQEKHNDGGASRRILLRVDTRYHDEDITRLFLSYLRKMDGFI